MILEFFMKAFEILFHPFRVINRDENLTYHHLTLFAAMVGLLPVISRFLSMILPETLKEGEEVIRPVLSFNAILCALGYWIMLLLAIWLIAFMIMLLAQRTAKKKHLGHSLRIVVYAMIPVFFSYIVPIFNAIFNPMGTMLSYVLWTYGIFLLLIGIRSLVPHKKWGIFLYLWGIAVFVVLQLTLEFVMSKC